MCTLLNPGSCSRIQACITKTVSYIAYKDLPSPRSNIQQTAAPQSAPHKICTATQCCCCCCCCFVSGFWRATSRIQRVRHDLTLQTASTVREGVDLPKSILHRNVPLHEPGLDFIPGQLTHCGRPFHYPLSPPQRSIFK